MFDGTVRCRRLCPPIHTDDRAVCSHHHRKTRTTRPASPLTGLSNLEQCKRRSVRTFALFQPYLAWRRIATPSWLACDDQPRVFYGRRPTPATSWTTSRPISTIPPSWAGTARLGRPYPGPCCSHAVVRMACVRQRRQMPPLALLAAMTALPNRSERRFARGGPHCAALRLLCCVGPLVQHYWRGMDV